MLDPYLDKLAQIFGLVGQTADQLQAVVYVFQKIYGLKDDGWLGPITQRAIDSTQRLCATPENLGVQKYGFPGTAPIRIAYEQAADAPRPVDVMDCLSVALAEIGAVCGARFEHNGNVQGRGIRLTFAPIDGLYGTLAKSELATHAYQTPRQWYDPKEPWHLDPETPPGQGRVSLKTTMVHELSHALGVVHGGDGLMAPLYQPQIQTLQPGYDIDSLLALYGPSASEPPPAPPELPAVTVQAEVAVNGTSHVYAGELQPVTG